MKILITGVLGVIGSKLEEILKIKGYKVYGIDLYHTNRIYGHGLGKVANDDYFRCDIGEYRQIEDIIEYVKPDLVYHCAAEFGRWNGEHFYEKVWKTNAIGTKNIIRLQEKYRFKLVHCSSSEVYGDYEGVMYEDVLKQVPINQMNDYAMSKRVNEMQISNSRDQYRTETVVVRFFNTYGPGEWYHPFRSVNCVFTYNLLHGKPITVFKGHTRTSTYIYDCVRTLSNIVDNFVDGEVYNIASNQEHSIEQLTELLVKYTKASPGLVTYQDHHEILTTKHKHVDNSKSVRDLKHKNTVSLEEGVWETVQWMKEYYRI
jgi:dTDP-glucose 4,6-dehydratase